MRNCKRISKKMRGNDLKEEEINLGWQLFFILWPNGSEFFSHNHR